MPALARPVPALDRPARRRAGRIAAAGAQAVGLPLASVAISAVAIRAAGVETWGAFVGTLIVVQLLAQILDLGSRDSLLRSVSRSPANMAHEWRRAAASRAPLVLVAPVVFVAFGNDPWMAVMLTIWVAGVFLARLHDGVVAFRRAFGFALCSEVLAVMVTLALVVAVGAALDVGFLIVAFTVAAWVRACAVVARFPMLRPGPGWGWSAAELRRSWPFFGLAFSGAIQSRVDLYVVAAMLPAASLGAYQVLTGMVLVGQSLAGALVGPVAPALYRLGSAATERTVLRLAGVGVVVASGCAAGIALLTPFLFGIATPSEVLLVAWLAMLPVWAYLPLVHLAFRAGDERVVLGANLLGIAVAGIGALLLVPALGLTGALGAAAVAQSAILAVHLARTRRRGAVRARDGRAVDAEGLGALSDL